MNSLMVYFSIGLLSAVGYMVILLMFAKLSKHLDSMKWYEPFLIFIAWPLYVASIVIYILLRKRGMK